MKVYVILKGQYSDTHILGVTKSKDEAEEICSAINRADGWRPDARFEEYDTDQFQINMMRFEVHCDYGEWKAKYDEYDLYDKYTENGKAYDGVYIVYAKSPETAIKIAQDMVAEELAEKKGVKL